MPVLVEIPAHLTDVECYQGWFLLGLCSSVIHALRKQFTTVSVNFNEMSFQLQGSSTSLILFLSKQSVIEAALA